MRLHRFFITQPLGEEIVINNKELLKQWFLVFRYKVGDAVVLFNGDGNDYTYSIISHSKADNAALQYIRSTHIPSITKHVNLFVSLIKKDNVELIIQKGTELGVSSFTLFTSSRSEKKSIDLDRLIRIATEASEQCGRADIPVIKGVFDFSVALNALKNMPAGYVLDMDGIPISTISSTKDGSGQDVSLCIGPEGGWTDEERVSFKESQLQSVSLTDTVLRAETAAIVGAYAFLSK